jgi:heat shock protein HtpX
MNTLKATFLTTLLTVILISVGGSLGGEKGVLITFSFALIMHGISYWFSDKIVLRLYRAKKIEPDEALWLYRIVRELTLRAQMPMPRLYWIPPDSPNPFAAIAMTVFAEFIFHLMPKNSQRAFAAGRDERHAAVAVTKDVLRVMDDAALRGLLAHELAHVKNRETLVGTIAATMAGAVAVWAHIAQ